MERLTLNQIKNSAFGQWCKNQTREDLIKHVYHCLISGDSNNMVWQLIDLLGIVKLNETAIFTIVDFLQRGDS